MLLIKKHWFLAGLLLVFAVTLGDMTGSVAEMGKWLKAHQGPDIVIFLIFLFSGLTLDVSQIRSGLTDVTGILLSLGIIFGVAPIIGMLFGVMPLGTGVKIGMFLVAVMPTTLSSGVVMTGAAGGNMAHALAITILANALAVFTIPLTLSLLLKQIGGTVATVSIDQLAIMTKLGCLLLLPLCLGLGMSWVDASSRMKRIEPKLQRVNQCLILCLVWMALSETRPAIISGKEMIGGILLLVVAFHGALLASACLFARLFRLGRGRRESVIFMGGQKTLTLSVILQVSLFPEYGLALAVCVLHHIVHLMMDGYLVQKLSDCD